MTIPIFPDLHGPLVLAHRGASADHPENTLAAFGAAVRARADLVELDVRLTRDGVAVVLHDADLSRTTDLEGPVHALTLAEVKRADASGGRGARQEVPTLEEVFRLLEGTGTGVDVEIKSAPGEGGSSDEELVGASLAASQAAGFTEPIMLSSFNLTTIDRARRIAPRVPTGVLTIDAIPPARALEHALEAGHPVILPGAAAVLAAGAGFVAEAHEAGVAVVTWTVDEEDALETLFSWGVDGVATNDPALGVAVRDRLTG